MLHRDVSIGNIMMTFDSDGRCYGILSDWDHSASLEKLLSDEKHQKFRTVSAGFIALDIR